MKWLPRFPFLLASVLGISFAAISTACIAQNRPLAEVNSSPIGYRTVAAALADLRSKPGVVFSTENGWTIATDRENLAIWSFAPAQYPAYPAVVRRRAVPHGAHSMMEMSVLCEAEKKVCDDLVRTFSEMNGLDVQ